MKKHRHEWYIQRTYLIPPCLLAKCKCGKKGIVEELTLQEWEESFLLNHNGTVPYKWKHGSGRVNIDSKYRIKWI